MTSIDFNSPEKPDYWLEIIRERSGRLDRGLTFMEVCGTHTMSAARSGLHNILPEGIRLISGPGCPVCVTPVGYVDHAIAVSKLKNTIIATFGDLMRVPGSVTNPAAPPPTLLRARAEGADIRVVYSPLDSIKLAEAHPGREVIFLGVGFETTAPTLAASILSAARAKLDNYSMLVAAKTIPQAMNILANSKNLNLNGFLCPGHVSCIIGTEPYERLGLPSAIAGFEPEEILRGIAALVTSVKQGSKRVINCYRGVVRREGNRKAQKILYSVFEPSDSNWRGLGPIPGSGLALSEAYHGFDAGRKFDLELPKPVEPPGCRCGEILTGLVTPTECPLFGKRCTPESPIGACMVSTEGTCAAHYNYLPGDVP